MAVPLRRTDADKMHIGIGCLCDFGREPQVSAVDMLAEQRVKIGLVERRLAILQSSDLDRIDVDADDRVTELGQAHGMHSPGSRCRSPRSAKSCASSVGVGSGRGYLGVESDGPPLRAPYDRRHGPGVRPLSVVRRARGDPGGRPGGLCGQGSPMRPRSTRPHSFRRRPTTRCARRLPRAAHPRGVRRAGADALATCIVVEEVARACAASSLIPAVNKLGTTPLLLAGSARLNARYLPAVARGEAMFSYALSEREAGSDPVSMSTRAVPNGDGWVLSGQKSWVTNAGSRLLHGDGRDRSRRRAWARDHGLRRRVV